MEYVGSYEIISKPDPSLKQTATPSKSMPLPPSLSEGVQDLIQSFVVVSKVPLDELEYKPQDIRISLGHQPDHYQSYDTKAHAYNKEKLEKSIKRMFRVANTLLNDGNYCYKKFNNGKLPALFSLNQLLTKLKEALSRQLRNSTDEFDKEQTLKNFDKNCILPAYKDMFLVVATATDWSIAETENKWNLAMAEEEQKERKKEPPHVTVFNLGQDRNGCSYQKILLDEPVFNENEIGFVKSTSVIIQSASNNSIEKPVIISKQSVVSYANIPQEKKASQSKKPESFLIEEKSGKNSILKSFIWKPSAQISFRERYEVLKKRMQVVETEVKNKIQEYVKEITAARSRRSCDKCLDGDEALLKNIDLVEQELQTYSSAETWDLVKMQFLYENFPNIIRVAINMGSVEFHNLQVANNGLQEYAVLSCLSESQKLSKEKEQQGMVWEQVIVSALGGVVHFDCTDSSNGIDAVNIITQAQAKQVTLSLQHLQGQASAITSKISLSGHHQKSDFVRPMPKAKESVFSQLVNWVKSWFYSTPKEETHTKNVKECKNWFAGRHFRSMRLWFFDRWELGIKKTWNMVETTINQRIAVIPQTLVDQKYAAPKKTVANHTLKKQTEAYLDRKRKPIDFSDDEQDRLFLGPKNTPSIR